MTDDPSIAEIVDGWDREAQENHDSDPLGWMLGILREWRGEMIEPHNSEEFVKGYDRAIYFVAQAYVEYSGHYPCDCPTEVPMAELGKDGKWHCARCRVFLVREGDEVVDVPDDDRPLLADAIFRIDKVRSSADVGAEERQALHEIRDDLDGIRGRLRDD